MPWLVPLGPANHAKRRLRYVRGLVFEFEIEFRPEVAGTTAYIQHTVAWVYLGKVLQKHTDGRAGRRTIPSFGGNCAVKQNGDPTALQPLIEQLKELSQHASNTPHVDSLK